MTEFIETPLTAEEYYEWQAAEMSETALQKGVENVAKRLGWLAYHTYDSRRSAKGFLDLCLVHPDTGRLLFRELKTQKGRTTPEQRDWIAALELGGHDVGIWRPIDLFSGRIHEELKP